MTQLSQFQSVDEPWGVGSAVRSEANGGIYGYKNTNGGEPTPAPGDLSSSPGRVHLHD